MESVRSLNLLVTQACFEQWIIVEIEGFFKNLNLLESEGFGGDLNLVDIEALVGDLVSLRSFIQYCLSLRSLSLCSVLYYSVLSQYWPYIYIIYYIRTDSSLFLLLTSLCSLNHLFF